MPRTYKDMDKSDKGDPNIMKLKEVNKIRPLDNVVAGWRQHGIEHPSDPEQFASVVCPGPRSCPLCRKPVNQKGEAHFPISRRFAANVWDYDTNSIKVLVAGPMVFDEFKTAAQVGIDPATCDWTITKTGQGRGTEYKVIRHDVSPFTARDVTPEDLHSVDKYETPTSAETIFEILERFGIDYDSLTIPSYTYEQALEFRFPYTKHKGETVEEVLDADESFAEWLHGTKLEQGQLGDPVFLALQTAMEERGLVPALDDALAQLPEPEEPAVQHTPTVNQASESQGISEGSANMVPLIGPDDKEVMVPPSAVEAMLKAGFKEPPAPSEPEGPMTVEIGGKLVELPPEQAQALIDAGSAKLPDNSTTPEPEPPTLPLPDEEVKIEIGGTEVEMPFIQAAPLVDAGTATFADPSLGEAFKMSKQEAGSDPSPQQSTNSPSTSPEEKKSESGPKPGDPEKPFRCDQCEAAYKTQGALTTHKNKVHKAATPQPSAVPASENGGGTVEERVKELIVRAPFARDYQKLIQIFEEETGISNFADMKEEQLLKVEKRIEKEMAKAT